jgi:hypothetical protein
MSLDRVGFVLGLIGLAVALFPKSIEEKGFFFGWVWSLWGSGAPRLCGTASSAGTSSSSFGDERN